MREGDRAGRIGCILLVAVLGAGHAGAEAGSGRIAGRILHRDGGGMSGVEVGLEGGRRAGETTDGTGAFTFEAVPAGTWTLRFRLGEEQATAEVVVEAGVTTTVVETLDFSPSFADSLTVYSASRRQERIVEAPAAVTTATEAEIQRAAPTGQIPKLFESAGVEITQSGLYDFKFNVRGLNQSVNRRVAVLIDGRDPSFPFLGAQEWASLAFPMDDIASAELVLGPSSALYGANAFNGILNLITKAPGTSPGGFARLTAGELSTVKADFRVAASASEKTHYKVVGGATRSDDFYVSRDQGVEYSVPCPPGEIGDCVFLEAGPLPLDRDEIAYLSARVDHDLAAGRSLVVEGGTADVQGYVLTSPGARFQITDLSRPWARVDLSAPHWNLLVSYTGREAEARNMSSGGDTFTDSYRAAVEAQGRWTFAEGRGRVVLGGSAGEEDVDSANPQGVQTLLPEPTGSEVWAAFGQLDWELGADTKLVVALRLDDSTLHDVETSPRASIVHALSPRHTMRLTYGEGFQRPNYPEYFVRVDLAPPLDLSLFEAICALGQVACGFDQPVRIIGVGSDDLTVEKIETVELGYTGILADRVFLTVDLYSTRVRDFVLQFVPQLGTVLGRTNPDFGPYAPPAGLDPALAALLTGSLEQALGPFYAFLSTEHGLPLFVLNSAVNYGEAETVGLEVRADVDLGSGWGLDLSYSYLDFDAKQELAEAPFEANRPESLFGAGVDYRRGAWSAALDWRRVGSFRWAEGILIGDVEAYDVANLSALFDVSETWGVGLNVSNLFDDVHYELFSGDLLGRRALAHATYRW